ncbi:MAG: HepT-like ribonuclease domain-containing protein [Rhodospirillaceae bacterium]
MDMIDACERIESYIDGHDFLSFQNDMKTVDAVCRCLGIVGEAANSYTKHCRVADTNIQWSEIVSLRNRIIHEYSTVNLKTVWGIGTEEVPLLKVQLTALLAELEERPVP